VEGRHGTVEALRLRLIALRKRFLGDHFLARCIIPDHTSDLLLRFAILFAIIVVAL